MFVLEISTKEDICTHLGDEYDRYLGAIVPPIFQNSLFTCKRSQNAGYHYTRTGNPTIEIAEQKIAALEEGEAAVAFSSGMAAITSALMHHLDKDSHVVALRNIYGPARDFLDTYLTRFGISITYVTGDSMDELAAALRPETRLIYLESPTTFLFTMHDLQAIADLARSHGAATIIDNTWATPLYQNPLRFGIDMVLHSASKYLGGHSDIVAGIVVGKREAMERLCRAERALFGGVMDPHQSWLLTRGLRTLPIRMKQHQENAMAVAQFLERHPKVERVLFPGLPSHPQYELGRRQMAGYSGLFSFLLRGTGAQAIQFGKALEFFEEGPSWGGFESLYNPIGVNLGPAGRAALQVPENLIRISVGLENLQTILRDLDQALHSVAG